MTIKPEGLTVLSCDIESYAFKNDMENESATKQAAALINSVGLEIENSLSATEPAKLVLYTEGGVTLKSYNELIESDVDAGINEGFVNLIVGNLTDTDWDSRLVYVSGDANASICAIGYHPNHEKPVVQRYNCGELDTGIVADPGDDSYMSDDVTARMNELLRI